MRRSVRDSCFAFPRSRHTRGRNSFWLNEIKRFACTAEGLIIKIAVKFVIDYETESRIVHQEFSIVRNETTIFHTAMASKAVKWGTGYVIFLFYFCSSSRFVLDKKRSRFDLDNSKLIINEWTHIQTTFLY